MTIQREIHTGVDVSLDYPDTWRLYAECPDATTEIIVMGDVLPMPAGEGELGTSGWSALLIGEHLDRCADCAAWRKRATA